MQIRSKLFLMLLLTITACTGKKVTTRYDSGIVKEEYQVDDDGRKHGPYTLFYENGKVREDALYHHDTLAGKRTLYFQNGNPEVEEPYDQRGQLHGKYRQYFEEGGIKLESQYVNHVITGILKVYYPEGQVKEEVTMVDNLENGPFTEFHPNGQIQWKGTYKDGDDEFGWLEQYDSKGQLIKVMRCDTPGICRTKWKPGMPPLAR